MIKFFCARHFHSFLFLPCEGTACRNRERESRIYETNSARILPCFTLRLGISFAHQLRLFFVGPVPALFLCAPVILGRQVRLDFL